MPARPPTESDVATLDTIASDAVAPTAVSARDTERNDPSAMGRAATEVFVSSQPAAVEVTAAPLADAGFDARYEVRTVLGAGGMGEVRLAKDRRVGREVALKVMREPTSQHGDARVRFLREARIQGQLEHPTVVPVYDLGERPDGAAFFTMKRVRGLALDAILHGLREKNAEMEARYSRRKLLTAFASVCLSVEFAHARGVLHRDLKPANIMLGDFGEVHVLDWGLAKLLDGRPDGESARDDEVPKVESQGVEPARTLQGALMGTPGYMSPEQVRGEVRTLDARTDVYALGAILFEIVTLHSLHEGRTLQKVLLSTAEGVDARPSVRYPDADVAPELEAICVRATQLDPNARFGSAREIADAVERFLDGDRDLQRRRELAAMHLDRARTFAAAALAGTGARDARAQAMREVTRALAFDPHDDEAVRMLTRMLVEVPDEMPPEAEAELAQSATRARVNAARISAIRYLTWLAFVPILASMGIRSYPQALIATGFTVAATLFAYGMYRRGRTSAWNGLSLLVLSSLAVSWLSALLGPFILVPGLVSTNTMFFSLHAAKPARRVIALLGALTMLVPAALEAFHLVPPAYAFAHGAVTVLPRMTFLPAHQTLLVMVTTSVALVVTPTVLAGRVRDALAAAERRLFLHAWQLRQLVPDEARAKVAVARG